MVVQICEYTKTTEVYSLNRSVVWYVIYMSMKLFKKSQQRGILLQTWPVLLETVKVMKNKTILRSPVRSHDAK